MSPEVQAVTYAAAIIFFVLGAWGVTNTRHPVALGWIGAALVAVVLLAGALDAA